MHILHVVGARPNFMKAAPVLHALGKRSAVKQSLVHTGQHYDPNMSDVFFSQLEIPAPDVNLGVGSGSHAQQTAEIMTRFEADRSGAQAECRPGLWGCQFHGCGCSRVREIRRPGRPCRGRTPFL